MISKDKIVEYMLINEKARYDAFKAFSTTFKHICITILICITIVACVYMYFVVPVEEETFTADHGSQIVESSHIGGNNGM
jgi:hypothetical protein